MMLQHARRHARVDVTSTMVPLETQDRTLWRRDEIDAGTELLTEVLSVGQLCSYLLQAAIAVLHSGALEAAATDWKQIVLLYRELQRLFPSPVVSLNLAVALGNLRGPKEALKQIDQPKS